MSLWKCYFCYSWAQGVSQADVPAHMPSWPGIQNDFDRFRAGSQSKTSQTSFIQGYRPALCALAGANTHLINQSNVAACKQCDYLHISHPSGPFSAHDSGHQSIAGETHTIHSDSHTEGYQTTTTTTLRLALSCIFLDFYPWIYLSFYLFYPIYFFRL